MTSEVIVLCVNDARSEVEQFLDKLKLSIDILTSLNPSKPKFTVYVLDETTIPKTLQHHLHTSAFTFLYISKTFEKIMWPLVKDYLPSSNTIEPVYSDRLMMSYAPKALEIKQGILLYNISQLVEHNITKVLKGVHDKYKA